MRIVRALAAASAAGLIVHCTSASAQLASKGEAGELWETTVKMEMPGMPMSMPAQTHRMCLSKQAGDDKFIPRQENCKVTDTRRTGNTQHFKMVCSGKNAMTAEGDLTLAGTGYSGKMRMSGKMEGQSMEMSQTFSGKKLGDCTG
jgi:Protein of unknown function (DUF3617)